jgi:hypothetical protein
MPAEEVAKKVPTSVAIASKGAGKVCSAMISEGITVMTTNIPMEGFIIIPKERRLSAQELVLAADCAYDGAFNLPRPHYLF